VVNKETLLFAGIVLFVAGMFMLLAFYPTYSSMGLRIAGYETGSLTKADYLYYLQVEKIAMPLMILFVAIGVTLMVLGGFMREKKS